MRILITNDDGIDAPGLAVMREIAASDHRRRLGRRARRQPERGRAPLHLRPRAEARQARRKILRRRRRLARRLRRRRLHPRPRRTSRPTSSCRASTTARTSATSSTARAPPPARARARMQGAIGIAMSQGVDYEKQLPVVWDNATRFGADVVRGIVRENVGRDTWYNVNFPYCAARRRRRHPRRRPPALLALARSATTRATTPATSSSPSPRPRSPSTPATTSICCCTGAPSP